MESFATAEVASQNDLSKAWTVTSSNPRPSHAAMDGETVQADETFSNGARFPRDPYLGADEIAGCQCVLTLST